MSWGYLSEFWNSITEEIVEAGVYTIDWFQSVGNAVAGAIGGFFDDLIHHIYDIFYLLNWLLDSLQELFSTFFSPLTWVFNFGKGFVYTAFKTAGELGLELGSIGTFDQSVFDFFDAIPFFNEVMTGVSAILGILFLAFIIKKVAEI